MELLIFVIVAFVVWIITWRIGAENAIKRSLIKVNESESDIDVALLRRYDTLTKMRDICKQFAQHEHEILVETTEVRSGMSIDELKKADKQLDTLMQGINVVVEAYPEIRANEQFEKLSRAVWDIESQLQAARRIYNSNISAYNELIVTFPSRIVANSLGFEEIEFFETADVHKLNDVDMDMKL